MRFPTCAIALFFSLVLPALGLADSTIPFEFRDGLLWIKVAVPKTGEKLNFLLDSGAGATVLNLDTAKRLGLKLGRCQTVRGVHTLSRAYETGGFDGEIAGIPLPKNLLSIDFTAISQTCHQTIHGLLGADFLRGRVVQIDFAAGEIRLPGHAEPKSGDQVLPIKRRNDAMCIPVGIVGNPPQWLRLDTGCASAVEWVVSESKAKRVRDTSIGLTNSSVRSINTDLQLGNERLSAVKTGIHRKQIFTGEDGLLGTGVLSKFTVTIDAQHSRVILASN